MNFINGNEASFLTKLSEDVEEFIQVPTPFAKKYLVEKSKKKPKIVLKTKTGVEWKVKYFKIKDEHYFINGWLEFMKDNNLQHGDSLIFFLITSSSSPNLIFEVFFYEQNGCSKTTTSSVGTPISDNAGSGDGKKYSTEVASDDDDSSKNVKSSMILRKVVHKSYLRQMLLTRRFVKAAGIDGYLYLQLENDEGKKWEVEVRKWGREEIPHIVGGWSKFVKDNKVKVGNSCDIYHVKDNALRVHVYKEKRGLTFSKKPRTSSIGV